MRTYLTLWFAAATLMLCGNPVSAQNAGIYPPMQLGVPFLCQYPPGDAANTKNCGQTAGVMLNAYFNGKAPTAAMITAVNELLAVRFQDNRYRNPNGYYTGFTGRNELGELLKICGLKYRVATGNNLPEILKEVNLGRPVIVSVRISGGRLVSVGGVAHWALVVGWNQRDRKVILHDPGTINGRYIQYSESAFTATWRAAGSIMAPVSK